MAAAVDGAHATLGWIDILVNAAGVSGGATAGDLDEAEWDRIVDVRSTRHCCIKAARDLPGRPETPDE